MRINIQSAVRFQRLSLPWASLFMTSSVHLKLGKLLNSDGHSIRRQWWDTSGGNRVYAPWSLRSRNTASSTLVQPGMRAVTISNQRETTCLPHMAEIMDTVFTAL